MTGLRYRNYISLSLFFFFLLVSSFASAQRDFSKTLIREFNTGTQGSVKISSKYGKIDVVSWEENFTRIDVKIVAKAYSEAAARQVLDRIEVHFTENSERVTANTEIRAKQTNWWQPRSGGKADYSINFKVYTPVTSNILINLHHGDITMKRIEGSADIMLKLGSVDIEAVGDRSFFLFDYVNGSIGKINDAYAELSDSKIAIDQVKGIEIKSDKSKVTINKAGRVRCKTKYDDYTINEVNSLFNTGQYDEIIVEEATEMTVQSRNTDFSIGRINDRLEMDVVKGDTRVDLLAPSFSSVSLFGESASFGLRIHPDATFTLDAEADYAGISYPPELQISFEEENSTRHTVKGNWKKGKNNGEIVARLNHGGLKVSR